MKDPPYERKTASTANLRGCIIENAMWGADLGKNLPIGEGRVVMAANTFRNNESSDLVDQYNNKAAVVQPWRRGALSK